MKAKDIFSLLGISLLAGVVALFGNPAISLAAHHEDQKTTASELKEDLAETYETFKRFTLEQRDEAMAEAKKKLDMLDRRIYDFQTEIDNKWQDMSKETQKETRQTLNKLRKKREDLAEWLGGIQYGSKEAWEDVKKGFVDSYDRMEKAFEEARKDIVNEHKD